MYEIFKIGFLSVTIVDLLDIAIVGALFFWLYRALKDTIAVQILFGLVIVIFLSFITEAANLKSLNWILRTISDIWLLAFVILFQPEIRRLLLMITRSPIFRFFIKSSINQTIDEVIDAVKEMSEKHIGALLVFTRSQNVKMTVESGVPIQAKVSKEILISIFNVKSPLHDGAVIIDGDIIVAARCVLPLTTRTKFGNRNLGTRHRAALGLSEQIDSLVLVVSEETGGISIAEQGEFTYDIQRNNIAATLAAKLAE
jgi:diadenylate cyclase